MGTPDEHESPERIFTLSEANRLLPQLQSHLGAVKQGKSVLMQTREEIQRASSKAPFGGGSAVGVLYIQALQQISANLQAIQEMGVLVKDVDMGLCDFPYLLDGRTVYLCWKLGEREIRWWHEITTSYKDRHPLEGTA